MSFPFLQKLKDKRIVLASGSPRRKEILSNMGLNFDVVPSKFPETLDKSKYSPLDYVVTNATEKGLEVYKRLLEEGQKVDLVIAADTVVVFGGEILEKPKDKKDALNMLRKLNRNSHCVYTGIALVYPKGESDYAISTSTENTEVVFRNNSDEDFLAYIDTGEPLDKAGSYGIQAFGSLFIEKING
ncbi:24651_t:CDS:2 [Cetraspora pellucida]|uniref:24651_t:CDS:1 n=1 Tax=Cetraspora pellucida TaxID=1433469 RepID=A0A9N9CGU6_9GLOM|nr:24651_t:CDS:2 [Cetraspora pellucida]